MRRCFAWKMSSSDRCISAVRFTSISHFNIEKSDSTDVVLASTIASPPCSRLKRPEAQSHASLNVVVWSCLSMMSHRIVLALYNFKSSRCSASIYSAFSSDLNEEMSYRNRSSTSFRKTPWCSLTIWAGRTGGASFFDARLSPSRSTLTYYRLATSAIAYVAICWSRLVDHLLQGSRNSYARTSFDSWCGWRWPQSGFTTSPAARRHRPHGPRRHQHRHTRCRIWQWSHRASSDQEFLVGQSTTTWPATWPTWRWLS